jgi:hypothetical protein
LGKVPEPASERGSSPHDSRRLKNAPQRIVPDDLRDAVGIVGIHICPHYVGRGPEEATQDLRPECRERQY